MICVLQLADVSGWQKPQLEFDPDFDPDGLEEGVTKLQALYRGRKDRKDIHEQTEAATKVQVRVHPHSPQVSIARAVHGPNH